MAKDMEKSSSSSPATPSEITHHFFKVFLPSFSLHKLKIPTTFMKKLNGVISKKVILKDPRKRLWHVKVTKVKGVFYFQNGWEEFVKYNCLKMGEFLVFRYVGNSVFYVDIFDNSGCVKKVDSLGYVNNINITTTKINTGLVMKEVESKDGFHFTKKLNKTTTLSVSEEEVESDNQTYSDSVSWPSDGEEDDEEEIYKSKRSAATNGEMEEISNPVEFIESKLPHFVASVKSKNPNSLLIPSKLMRRDDIDIKREMVLLTICFLNDRTVIGKGWLDFWRGNNLNPNDRCIFEFMKYKVRGSGKNSSVINVKFVRATEKRSAVIQKTRKRSSALHKTRNGTA